MYISSLTCRCLVLLLAGLLVGCCGLGGQTSIDGPRPDQGTPRAAPGEGIKGAQPSGPKTYRASQLPPLRDYLPPLDGGRVEAAAPKDWQVGSRKRDYVVWFYRLKSGGLPRITVTAVDAPDSFQENVTRENVEQFVPVLDEIVQESLVEGETLREPVVPLILGDNGWGRYVRGGKFGRGKAKTHRHFLATVRSGRLYTIEQSVLEGQIKKYRDDAYAVAAGMKFTPPAAEPSPTSEDAALE